MGWCVPACWEELPLPCSANCVLRDRVQKASKMAMACCRPWDADVSAIAREMGAEVLSDLAPGHAMRFASPQECWDVMMRAGPLHSRLLRYGEAHMQDLQRAFVSKFPPPNRPFDIAPNARMLLLRRPGLRASL